VAERVLQYTASIPAGTPKTGPVTVAMPFDNWEVEAIDLEVHPGPAATMGFYLANNGIPWIPRTPGEWLVWDDHTETFYPTSYPTASGWQVVGYNTGIYPHAVVVRFHVNALQTAAVAQDRTITFIEHGLPAPEWVTL
jgi:hypothetical protein